MQWKRNILTVSGALMLLIGMAYGLAPTHIAEHAGLTATASGLTDLRAVYGGVQFGLGCFLLWCSREDRLLHAGLAALGTIFGSVGVFRVLGLLVDKQPTPFHLTNLAVEVCVASLVVVVMIPRRPHDA